MQAEEHHPEEEQPGVPGTVGQQAPRWWVPEWSFLTASRFQGVISVLHTAPCWTMWVAKEKKKKTTQGNLGEKIFYKKRGGRGDVN